MTYTQQLPGRALRSSAAIFHPPRLQWRCRSLGHAGSRLLTHVGDISAAGDPAGVVLLGAIGSLAAAVPVSIALDGALDKAQDRVGQLTNASYQGTRFHVSWPAPLEAAAGTGLPAVVVVHQIFGLQQRELDLCGELAGRGYVAVAPDTFEGCATGWLPRALALGYQAAFRPDATWGVPAVLDAVEWLRSQPGVNPKRIVVAGFCYGGGSALRFAAAYPSYVAGVGVFYGRPLDQAACERLAAEDKCIPVFGVYGGKDKQFPPPMVDEFEQKLAAAGVPHMVRRYPRQGHAFITDLAATRATNTDAHDAWAAFLQFMREYIS